MQQKRFPYEKRFSIEKCSRRILTLRCRRLYWFLMLNVIMESAGIAYYSSLISASCEEYMFSELVFLMSTWSHSIMKNCTLNHRASSMMHLYSSKIEREKAGHFAFSQWMPTLILFWALQTWFDQVATDLLESNQRSTRQINLHIFSYFELFGRKSGRGRELGSPSKIIFSCDRCECAGRRFASPM